MDTKDGCFLTLIPTGKLSSDPRWVKARLLINFLSIKNWQKLAKGKIFCPLIHLNRS
jgi:hypothetical protein